MASLDITPAAGNGLRVTEASMRNKIARKPTSNPSKPAAPAVTTGSPPPMPEGYAWGCEEIGRVLRRNPRQTHFLAASGKFKSIRKIGNQWVANVAALQAEMDGEVAS
jgi:hypothetical protein